MGEKSDQIEKHIEQTRSELGDNISELQQKVKSAVDWREQFHQRPMTMLGIAFGGGVLLSALLGGRSRSRSENSSFDDSWSRATNRETTPSALAGTAGTFFNTASNAGGPEASKVSETWDNIKGALLGVAATKVRGYVEELIPGFDEHYRKREAERGSSTSFSSAGRTASKTDGHEAWPESGRAYSASS